MITGNTVMIKPGEQAPLTVLRLVEIANEVLPPGVLNAVPGLAAGAALAGHPKVERISFTGATATGRRVLETAAQKLTYATMELGGKNCLIVLPDADLDVAVEVAIEGMFYNQGEACTSTARILVHDDVYDEFVERFSDAAMGLVVGDGSIRDRDRADGRCRPARRVLRYLQTALDEGARIVAQGAVPRRRAHRRVLGGPDRAGRCHSGFDRGTGGDLRAHGAHDAVLHDRRGGRDRQRTATA